MRELYYNVGRNAADRSQRLGFRADKKNVKAKDTFVLEFFNCLPLVLLLLANIAFSDMGEKVLPNLSISEREICQLRSCCSHE
jgi:hypothetical protein